MNCRVKGQNDQETNFVVNIILSHKFMGKYSVNIG